jgi:predicted transport protein
MPIFRKIGDSFKMVKTAPLDKEKTLQAIIENNLLEMLDIYFLKSEYTTTFGGRIDTLAVDSNGAPVIIEYKRNKNDNVINQALSYLKWLKAQKSDFFEMLVQKTLGKDMADKLTIDWKNPRVICIAETYNRFDLDTVEVIPLRIELYKYVYYENDLFHLERLNVGESKVQSEVAPKVPTTPGTLPEKGSAEHSLESLLSTASPKIEELFQELRQKILILDESIIEKITQGYVAYRMTKNFAEVSIGKNQIKIHMRPINYDDPKGKVEKIPDGYNWTLDKRIYLKNEDELDYVMEILEQSFKDVL